MQGTLLGPYRLLAQIGTGGTGTVWSAAVEGAVLGVPVGERVALKVMDPRLAVETEVFERFVREAAIGRAIRHENLVRTLDAGMDVTEDGERVYLAMELVAGRALSKVIEPSGRATESFQRRVAPEGLCRRVAREVTKALCALHERGVLHGDVRPANVFLTQDEGVKLTDLAVGWLRAGAHRPPRARDLGPSARYAAPERFTSADASDRTRVDLFALGVTLYEMAVGSPPWDDADDGGVPPQALVDAPSLADARPDVSEFFALVVAALLDRDPERAVVTAGELYGILAAGEHGPWARARRHGPRVRFVPAAQRSTRLRGREPHVARLWGLLREAAAGRGGAAVVEGPPGSGKTRLLDELQEIAAADDLALDVSRVVLDGTQRGAGVLTFRDAGRGTRLRIVEHVELADAAAWDAIAALAAERRGLLVLTSQEPAATARARGLGDVAEVLLAPLDLDALGDLAADVVPGARPSRALLAWVAARSCGVAGEAIAWLRALAAGGTPALLDDGTWTLPHPLTVRRPPDDVVAWGERALRGVGDADRELLDAAACAGRDFAIGPLAAVLGTVEPDVAARCGVLERRGILRPAADGRWEFASGAARAAIDAALPAALRAEVHATFAKILLGSPDRTDADSAALVEHLRAADDHALPPADVVRAFAHLSEARRPDALLDLCDAVLRSRADDALRREARLRRARAWLELGRRDDAARDLDVALGRPR